MSNHDHAAVPLGLSMRRHATMRPLARGQIRHAIFDFDGTLSLLRAGWQEVMVSYFDEILAQASTTQVSTAQMPAIQSTAQRRQLCLDFITRLTGRQTIYQCLELARIVTERGCHALAAEAYKAEFLRRLHRHIDKRRVALNNGQPPTPYLVPGTLEMLIRLRQIGVTCYLASGTDVAYVRQEARMLGVDRFFGDHRIHGALDDYRKFSKRIVIEQILERHDLQGSELVAFGDGFVEIEETLRVGGWTVGVASDETRVGDGAQPTPTRHDGNDGPDPTPRPTDPRPMDPWKVNRLWHVGAHILTPDWLEGDVLLRYLGLDQG